MTEFILASKSPRRKMLLRNLVDSFIIVNSEIEESQIPGESPGEFVLRLAREKALQGAAELSASSFENAAVIGADTIVIDGEEILGKPLNAADAVRVLTQLKGRTHQVLSGIAVCTLTNSDVQTRLVCTEVGMREYTEDEIQEYVASGDPMDKAGSYGIQNRNFNPIPEFNGCQANVMGLPLCHLAVLMSKMGYKVDQQVAARCQKSIDYQCPVYDEILSEINGYSTESKLL